MSKELLKKSGLHRAAPLNDRLRPLGADEQRLSTVALDRLAPQIALAHELINIHRDEVGLDAPDLHDVARRPVAGVVGKKHQNVKGGLRQLQLAAKRLAGGGIGTGKFMGKFHTGVHTQDSFPNNAKLNSSNLN